MTALTQYARSGPDAATSAPPSERPDRGRRPTRRLEQRVRASASPLSATRFGSPASTAGRKNAVADPGDERRARRSRRPSCANGSATNTTSAAEVGADHQPLAREAVDERPEQQPEDDGRQDVRDEQGARPTSPSPSGRRRRPAARSPRASCRARSRAWRGRAAGTGRRRQRAPPRTPEPDAVEREPAAVTSPAARARAPRRRSRSPRASPTVTRIAVGEPKPCSGRTITPSRSRRRRAACASSPVST